MAGRLGDRLDLEVDHLGGRAHQPIAHLRRNPYQVIDLRTHNQMGGPWKSPGNPPFG